jgi:hypothetical protein
MPLVNFPGGLPDAHRTLRRDLAAVGITEPPGVSRACAIDDALLALVNTDVMADITSEIIGTTKAAVIADKAMKAATSLVAADRLGQVHRDAQRTLDRIARQALYADAERILDELRPMFDDAVPHVAEVVESFGSLTPAPAILEAPGPRRLWDRAVEARQQLDRVLDVRRDLQAVGYGPPETNAWFLTTSHDLAAADDTNLEGLVGAGWPVRLNTLQEIDEVEAAQRAEEEQRAARADQRRRAQVERDPYVRNLRIYEQQQRDAAAERQARKVTT